MDSLALEVLGSTAFDVRFHHADPSRDISALSGLQRLDAWTLKLFPWRRIPFRILRIPLRRYVQTLKWKLFPPRMPSGGSASVVTIPIPTRDYEDWWWDKGIAVDDGYIGAVQALTSRVARGGGACCSSELLNRVLVLRRPSTPQQKRAIANQDHLVQGLSNRGFPAVVYEPGAHSFRCQVEVFRKARAIIGWRGAEFANLLWCEHPIPIVVFQHRDMHGSDAPQERLGEVLGLSVTVVERSEGQFTIDADDVLSVLQTGEVDP